MTDAPPFRPGQVVETDWLRTGRWQRVEVERCERAPHATQTGWLVFVKGGLPSSVTGRDRIPCLDAGWFRPLGCGGQARPWEPAHQPAPVLDAEDAPAAAEAECDQSEGGTR